MSNSTATGSYPLLVKFVSQEFTECQTLSIIAEPLLSNSSVIGVAPFYLIAFEVGGIPTTTMVGSNPSNLSWTANHKRGSSQFLSSDELTPMLRHFRNESHAVSNGFKRQHRRRSTKFVHYERYVTYGYDADCFLLTGLHLPAGSDTSCIPPPPSNTATLASVHPNVTDPSTLTTCQPWGLTIKNGKQPYQVVLSALNSGVITNVTMGDGDSTLR